MPWRVEREIKSDGTIVCRAVYESEQSGPYRGYHVGMVTCPICGERGELLALYFRRNEKWLGPYFYVKHHMTYHDPKIYRRMREKRLSSRLASSRASRTLHLYNCYIGKRYPRPIPKPIPAPEG